MAEQGTCDVCGRRIAPAILNDRGGIPKDACWRVWPGNEAHGPEMVAAHALECSNLGYQRLQAKLEQAERENIRLRQLLFIGLHLTEDTRNYADGTTRLAHAHDVVFPSELFTDPSADCLGAWQSHVGAALRTSGNTAIVAEPARWKCSLCGVSGPKTLGAMNEHLLSCAKRPPTAAESALAAAQGALRRAREWFDAGESESDAEAIAEIDAALAAESGKPEPRSVFPPHNDEPSAPIMARCPGCEAVKALLESGKIGTSRHEVECAARALWLIGNARIGDRPWDRVAHHYLFEAEAALLAARGLEYRIEPPPESSNAEPRAAGSATPPDRESGKPGGAGLSNFQRGEQFMRQRIADVLPEAAEWILKLPLIGDPGASADVDAIMRTARDNVKELVRDTDATRPTAETMNFVLDAPRAAPPALPAELSGEGEHRQETKAPSLEHDGVYRTQAAAAGLPEVEE